MVGLYEMDPQRLFQQLNSSVEPIAQAGTDRLADEVVYYDEQGGEEKVKKELERDAIV